MNIFTGDELYTTTTLKFVAIKGLYFIYSHVSSGVIDICMYLITYTVTHNEIIIAIDWC